MFLVEKLAAGGAVDLRAQFGDTVLIGELLFGLVGDERAQHIVPEGEVGRRRDRPAGHDDDGADGDPECDRTKSDLPPGMRDGVAGARCGLPHAAPVSLALASGRNMLRRTLHRMGRML